jgi:hypothetical protein
MIRLEKNSASARPRAADIEFEQASAQGRGRADQGEEVVATEGQQ